MPGQLVSLIGFVAFPLLAFLFSLPYWRQVLERRSAELKAKRQSKGPLSDHLWFNSLLHVFPWRIVLWGAGLQVALAALMLKTRAGEAFFAGVRDVVNRLMGFTQQGTAFMFGPLGTPESTATVMGLEPGNGMIVAIHGLFTIVFIGALVAMLYHLGVMQLLIRVLAWIMRRSLGTSGPESLGAAANVFIGPGESAFTIKPHLPTLSRAEMFALLVSGLATVSGNVLVVYAGFGADAGHLLAASIISAPAALMIARLMVPEVQKMTGEAVVDTVRPKADGAPGKGKAGRSGRQEASREEMERSPYANVLDAAAQGSMDGIRLVMLIVGIVVAFVALIFMLDTICIGIGGLLGANTVMPGQEGYDATRWAPTSLTAMAGICFMPVAWLIGIPAQDVQLAGQLLGTKTILNEFIAFHSMTQAPAYADLAPRTRVLMTYALCGFANFGSLGIAIGSIGGLAPTRRADVAKLALRAMVGGMLAAFMTACVAGVLLTDADIDRFQQQRQEQTAPDGSATDPDRAGPTGRADESAVNPR